MKRSFPAKRTVHDLVEGFLMNDKVAEEIRKKAVNGRLSCPAARKIAQELSVSFREIGRTADQLEVKITDCELGCF
jgi:hypothetical protein